MSGFDFFPDTTSMPESMASDGSNSGFVTPVETPRELEWEGQDPVAVTPSLGQILEALRATRVESHLRNESTTTMFSATPSTKHSSRRREVIEDMVSSLQHEKSDDDPAIDSVVSFTPLKLERFSINTLADSDAAHTPDISDTRHYRSVSAPSFQLPEEDTSNYPGPAKTALIMFSLYISIFLVALDRTILGPAIPAITNQFKSIDDIGWYGSAYMLTSCGFILLYGRIYTFFSTKLVFLSSVVLFEIGSAVCGAAPSSLVLIIGRAIAGLGASGIFTGAILIMMKTVPLHRRPMLQGLFGACFGVASVGGPLLGGAFTGSKATWRWCFYINLPLGGFTIAVCVLFLQLEKPGKIDSWKEMFFNLDPLGTLLFVPGITCLLLALEWGGTEYAWSEGRMIALLVVFAVLFFSFIALQYCTRHSTATVPGRILFQRSVAFGGCSQLFVGSTMLTVSIYLPLWFQAIKSDSAMQSGINTIPLVLSVVVGSIMSGGLTQRIGYYTPFMILGSILMSVGTGLITTWKTTTGHQMWIGYQVILGLGVGCTMQHPNLAVQIVLDKKDVPTGTAILSFCQTLGGAVFVAVGQNTFLTKFLQGLGRIEGLDPEHVVDSGATALKSTVPQALLPRVIQAYNYALINGPFFAALIVACLSIPSALGMEWRSVKGTQQPPSVPNEENSTEPSMYVANELGSGSSRASTASVPASRPSPVIQGWKNACHTMEANSRVLIAKMNPDLELGPR